MQPGIYVFSVKELTRYIKSLLERDGTLQRVLVRGEISNCKYHSSGHFYFTLKDDASELRCVMWRERVQALGFRCEDGMKVIAEGAVTVYERSGQYQLYAHTLQAEGVGNLFMAFEQLKRKLEAEGLFAPERKRPLPFVPHGIALLTSPTGAVVHDFVTVSGRRWPGRRIVLVPTPVQGSGAPAGIVRSLQLARRVSGVDVIVLARGGGSFEELNAFNDEAVARAIAASPIPVVSAVGHETDFTIADFAADLRAPTPSAAAEQVVPDLRGVSDYLLKLQGRVFDCTRRLIDHGRRDLERALAHPALRSPLVLVRQRRQDLDFLGERIDERVRQRLEAAARRLQSVEGRLDALDPRNVLSRGYALVTRPADGALLPTVAQAEREAALDIRFTDGTLRAKPER
jgi:exodeoxyribonuclease VII large subunit